MESNPSNSIRPVQPEDLEGDAIMPGNPLFGTVWINPNRMSGSPCFYGTRVPVKHLFDYLRAGSTLVDFFDDFPGVTRQQAETVLEKASEFLGPMKGHAA